MQPTGFDIIFVMDQLPFEILFVYNPKQLHPVVLFVKDEAAPYGCTLHQPQAHKWLGWEHSPRNSTQNNGLQARKELQVAGVIGNPKASLIVH